MIQLVSNNTNNFPIQYSTSNNIFQILSNNIFEISRNMDAFILDGIIINKNDYNYIKNLHILIGGQIIWNIPLILFTHIKEIDDEYIIYINNNILGKNNELLLIKDKLVIPLISIPYNMLEIRITSTYNNIPIKIIYKSILYNTNIRQIIARTNYDLVINQYQQFSFNNNSFNINPKLFGTAIYIELNDLLINYELKLCDHVYSRYDKYLISYNNNLIKKRVWTKYKSKAINIVLNKIFNDNISNLIEEFIKESYYLYCFPFDINFDDEIFTNINFSKIDNVEINLLTKNRKYNGNIIIKNKNILKYHSGIYGIGIVP
jgi:hypothetical protein